ncbi:MAG TPA: DUF1501 domain-containing protein [bacterium]|nr:DUF1501 domain-containing protein [bacterium]
MDKDHENKLSRRDFLKVSGAAGAGLALWSMPPWLHAAARAAAPGSTHKTLVVILQRGAADGLNIVVPFNDPNYLSARPTIGLKYGSGQVVDLNGQFGFHSALEPLAPLFKDGHLAVVHAAGSPDSTRSHFDAQDYMETGTPGNKGTSDGWLNRVASCLPHPGEDPLMALAISPKPPRILRGPIPVTSMTSLKDYDFTQGDTTADAFAAMYSGTHFLSKAGKATADSVKRLKSLLAASTGSGFVGYGNGPLSHALSDLAKVLKSGAEVRVAFIDIGGWDHHTGEEYRLKELLTDWGKALSAFWKDLDAKAQDVVLVSMTEFGRTVEENGSRGTDHGHASAMFVMGGPVQGGKVYGPWPGLERENRYENRDLAVTTDFRTVLSEALSGHLRVGGLPRIFPGFTPGKHVGFLKA